MEFSWLSSWSPTWPSSENATIFRNTSAGVQSIALTIATIVGGVWALWKFSALKSVEKAKLELELQSLKRPIIDLEMAITPLKRVQNINSTKFQGDANNAQIFQVLVSIENNGNDTASIDLSKESLQLRKLNSAVGNSWEGFQGAPTGYVPSAVGASLNKLLVLPRNTQVLAYLVEAEVEYIYISSSSRLLHRRMSSQVKLDQIRKVL